MPEEKTRTKIVTIKDTHIKSLKIKGTGANPLVIKNLTLKNVRLIFKLPPVKKEK
jgi:hypothetical protein